MDSQKTPTPQKEAPVTVEQKARLAALTAWIDLFDQDQQLQIYNTYTSFSPRVKNPAMWRKNIEEVVKQNGHSTETPMEMRWEASTFSDFYKRGSKFIGEMQINNVKISGISTRPISDADRANGLSWQGSVSIGFIRRYRANFITAPNFSGKEWLSAPDNTPLPPFSQWENEIWSLGLALRNGQWERGQGLIIKGGGALLEDIETPSAVLGLASEGALARGCTSTPGVSCQKIDLREVPATK